MGDQNNSVYEELIDAIGPRNRRVMKRCFMTGKQCIFSSQVSEGADAPMINEDGMIEDPPSVFVVMPFRPNLETFYRWSLKPFLTRGYGLPENCVQRADEVRDIGYIVCEKICRRIQEADLVISELSLSNANVFYETGLAYGLNRPTLLLVNDEDPGYVIGDGCIEQSLDLVNQSVLMYPGIQMLDIHNNDHKITRHIIRPGVQKGVIHELKISALKIERDETSEQDTEKQPGEDITFDFNKVLKGVIGVAMAEIRNGIESSDDSYTREPWKKVIIDIPPKTWREFSDLNFIDVDGRRGFNETAQQIESSFCTLIDVSHNDPVACFWLGYCHARGLNAIPVYRNDPKVSSEDNRAKEEEKEPRLAFDIRALWYAEYDYEKPYEFKTKICEILEHLLQRDLPDRQKRVFWDHFPPERKIRAFTGAVHVDNLNREMVGDWDVRAVSELFSYLPSVQQARDVELVTPLYSPEEAYNRSKKVGPAMSKEDFIQLYRQGIEARLENVNAIIIASPDVNPVTEYLLHKIYNVQQPSEPFEDCRRPNFNGFVVWKELIPQSKDQIDSSTEVDEDKFPRLFSVQTETVKKEKRRGFAQHALVSIHKDEALLKKYLSQDECREGDGFSLLGHLVVARYPMKAESDNLVVLLNGVSGPATFALAQLLTGGEGLQTAPEMKSASEQMLRKINEKLDKEDCLGVEAIVEVVIKPPDDSETTRETGKPSAKATTTDQDLTVVDNRRVSSWHFIVEPREITHD